MLRGSPAVAQRLQETEAALARLKSRPGPASVEQLVPRIVERYRAAIDGLERTLMTDPGRARTDLAEYVGPIRVTATLEEIRLDAQSGHLESVLLAATGSGGQRQSSVVAGACYSVGSR